MILSTVQKEAMSGSIWTPPLWWRRVLLDMDRLIKRGFHVDPFSFTVLIVFGASLLLFAVSGLKIQLICGEIKSRFVCTGRLDVPIGDSAMQFNWMAQLGFACNSLRRPGRSNRLWGEIARQSLPTLFWVVESSKKAVLFREEFRVFGGNPWGFLLRLPFWLGP